MEPLPKDDNRQEICGYPTKSGEPCQRPAGAGTDHPGVGPRWQHEQAARLARSTDEPEAGSKPAKTARPNAAALPSASEIQRRAAEYLGAEQQRLTEDDARVAAEHLPAAERIAKKAPQLKKYLSQLVVMGMMLRDYLSRRYSQVPWRIIAAIAAAVLYLANPMDLIPDVIPGVGYLDDVAVLALVWQLVVGEARKYARWKMAQPDCCAECRYWLTSAFPSLGVG